ncbi:GntR family transcriptional regulator [Actinotalea sp. BY-33]|uniref:GntR family transcriptional regulator n=1 Tax=Actinotalea soli TaxID=2819234 RepID=A0A939LUY3_9CELL|nr:GntR family transcriptional regulator [Actinotalea soli]MBO1751757.1 GntR family transcriptional regulator [Actinotalea soli]
MFTEDAPIFQQLAARIADDILAGVHPEESPVPSATDLAVFHQINPATASKGVNVLVDLGALYKKRGIGVFVATGARELLRTNRRAEFRREYVAPLVREARALDIDRATLRQMIDDEESSQQ